MTTIIQNIFKGAMISITILIAVAVIISIYPFKEYTFANQPYPVVNKQLRAGEPLLLKADYCKLSNASGDISIIFEGDAQYTSPKITFQADKGCKQTTLAIPTFKDLPPGLYRYHGHGEYKKYLVGQASIDAFSETFEIIK